MSKSEFLKILDSSPAPVNKAKLNWNGDSNILCSILRQLKNSVNGDNQPLIPNSYKEIALFLKENISEYDKVKIATIERLLNTDEIPKKADKKLVIYY